MSVLNEAREKYGFKNVWAYVVDGFCIKITMMGKR